MSQNKKASGIPRQKSGSPGNAMDWIEQVERDDPEFASMIAEEKKRLNIGVRIRELREEHQLTQVELAKKAATSQSMIARIETGNQDNLRMDTLVRLASALGLELDIVFRRPKQGSQHNAGAHLS